LNLDDRNETRTATFSFMDRIFLAIIVSGLLLAAASTSLLVLSDGGSSTVSVKTPAAALLKERLRP
jgi:hypothetical protein